MSKKLSICFLHLDLGIGGAERLVVDTALGLQNKGHEVALFSTHHDSKHCFKETIDGSFKSPVQVYGDFFPRKIAIINKFHIFFSTIRMIYLAFMICLFHRHKFDIFFVDQVSACIPILKWFSAPKKFSPLVLFYCHFPDKLLSDHLSIEENNNKNKKESETSLISKIVKKIKLFYRFWFDWLEEVTTGMADEVLVNSGFTKSMFAREFPTLRQKIVPKVVYPPINCEAYDQAPQSLDKLNPVLKTLIIDEKRPFFVSINRFEKKKNHQLALEAFSLVLKHISSDAVSKIPNPNKLALIICGGYEDSVPDNKETFESLKSRIAELSDSNNNHNSVPIELGKNVFLIRNFTSDDRYHLLHNGLALIYTPENEHFGIVPVEAQHCGLPVIAVNKGGPLESVAHGKTGYLMESDAGAFARAMIQVLELSEKERDGFRKEGPKRVKEMFSLEKLSDDLDEIVVGMVEKKEK